MRLSLVTVFTLLIAGTGLWFLIMTAVFFIGAAEQVTPAFTIKTIASRLVVMSLTTLMLSGIFKLGACFFPQEKILVILASRKVLLAILALSLVLLIAIWGPVLSFTK